MNLALDRAQKATLLAAGGLDAVLAATRAHPRDAEVQFRALFALINLVIPEHDGGARAAPDVRAAVAAVARAVLDAMAAFPDDEKLVRCGCLVLHNLSLDDPNVGALRAAGVAKPLLAAADSHADADVQRSAHSTMRRRCASKLLTQVMCPSLTRSISVASSIGLPTAAMYSAPLGASGSTWHEHSREVGS